MNPMCPPNDGIKDTEHFLLLCPTFEESRRHLLADVSFLLQPLGCTDLSNDVLLQVLLYGDKDFPDDLNRNILLLTFNFVLSTELAN